MKPSNVFLVLLLLSGMLLPGSSCVSSKERGGVKNEQKNKLKAVQSQPPTLRLGEQAPSFTLKGVDGNKHALSDYSDAEVLVIIFTCNHCPTAQAYEGRIKQMVRDYSDKPVSFVAISPNDPDALRLDELGYSDMNDSYEEMKIRAKEHNFNFPYLYDGDDQSASRKYGPVATPHVFIFDRERKLRYEGGIDNHENPKRRTKKYARNAINALLKGQEVTNNKTKVFGCSVKWAYKRGMAQQARRKFKKESVALKRLDLKTFKDVVEGKSNILRMVNVWATWCGPCKQEFPELVEIFQMYRGRNFKIITVSLDPIKKKKDALTFLKKQNASMNNYILPGKLREKFANILDPKWRGPLPHTVLINPDGEVIYRKTGKFDPHTIKHKIADELGRTYFE